MKVKLLLESCLAKYCSLKGWDGIAWRDKATEIQFVKSWDNILQEILCLALQNAKLSKFIFYSWQLEFLPLVKLFFHPTTSTKSQSRHLAHSCSTNKILLFFWQILLLGSFPFLGFFLGTSIHADLPLSLFCTWYLFWSLDFYHMYFFALL